MCSVDTAGMSVNYAKKNRKNDKKIQIGRLAHAYNLSDRTINPMVMAIGAHFGKPMSKIDIVKELKNKA
jgi:hypothetical protein